MRTIRFASAQQTTESQDNQETQFRQQNYFLFFFEMSSFSFRCRAILQPSTHCALIWHRNFWLVSNYNFKSAILQNILENMWSIKINLFTNHLLTELNCLKLSSWHFCKKKAKRDLIRNIVIIHVFYSILTKSV